MRISQGWGTDNHDRFKSRLGGRLGSVPGFQALRLACLCRTRPLQRSTQLPKSNLQRQRSPAAVCLYPNPFIGAYHAKNSANSVTAALTALETSTNSLVTPTLPFPNPNSCQDTRPEARGWLLNALVVVIITSRKNAHPIMRLCGF